MSTEANKQVVGRFVEEVVNRRKLELVDELVAKDFYGEFPISPEPVRGQDGYRGMLNALQGAFPDLVATTDTIVAEGDAVVVRLSLTGTQNGQLMQLPPSGRSATWPVIHMMRSRGSAYRRGSCDVRRHDGVGSARSCAGGDAWLSGR